MDKKETIVDTSMSAKASQGLQDEVKKELDIPDPQDRSVAKIIKENTNQ